MATHVATDFAHPRCGDRGILRRLVAVVVGATWWLSGLASAASILPGRAIWGQHQAIPRPAVAQIIAPEGNAVSYGTGTLIDVREQYGLVITNWHVVRDATGTVEVVFPCGFRSAARPLKVDADWDLAALVIWRPPLEPIPIAAAAPRPGEPLTICGWGQGAYREAVGRCTNYLAPQVNLPREMVELSVEARQGDSGGPILNAQDELAGVLFGAGRGFTLGSFGGRVQTFLTSLAPDIGDPSQDPSARQFATIGAPQSVDRLPEDILAEASSSVAANRDSATAGLVRIEPPALRPAGNPSRPAWQLDSRPGQVRHRERSAEPDAIAEAEGGAASPRPLPAAIGASQGAEYSVNWNELSQTRWFRNAQAVLAIVGIAAIFLKLTRMAA